MLDCLLEGSHSFSEVEHECHKMKTLQTTTDAFLKKLGCTWEEAVKAIPEYADQMVLSKYSRTSDSGPSEKGTLYVRPLYKGHCPRSQKITFPIVSIH